MGINSALNQEWATLKNAEIKPWKSCQPGREFAIGRGMVLVARSAVVRLLGLVRLLSALAAVLKVMSDEEIRRWVKILWDVYVPMVKVDDQKKGDEKYDTNHENNKRTQEVYKRKMLRNSRWMREVPSD